jgi:hypothetical protein
MSGLDASSSVGGVSRQKDELLSSAASTDGVSQSASSNTGRTPNR